MYFYPWGTHISWSTPSLLLLTPYSVGWFHPKTSFPASFFTESPVLFVICHPKTPYLVLTCPKVSYTYHQNPHFHWKLPYFCHKKTIQFLVNHTCRPLRKHCHRKTSVFKCLMYVTLYKLYAPWYLHLLSILSQLKSVSPTEVLPRSITQGHRPSGTRRAICTQSLPCQLILAYA